MVSVTVTPNARANGIDGIVQRPGGAALKVRVTEAPERGKANAALVKLLAREWGVPRAMASVAQGGQSRRKKLLVEGEPSALLRELQGWAKQRVGGE